MAISETHGLSAIPLKFWGEPGQSHLPCSIPTDGKLCDECAQWITRNAITHIRTFALQFHLWGSNPQPPPLRPSQLRNFQKRHLFHLFRLFRFMIPVKCNKRYKRNPYFDYFIFTTHQNEIKRIRISSISFIPFSRPEMK